MKTKASEKAATRGLAGQDVFGSIWAAIKKLATYEIGGKKK